MTITWLGIVLGMGIWTTHSPYIVRFMFVHGPGLLPIDKDGSTQWEHAAMSIATATLGAICLAATKAATLGG